MASLTAASTGHVHGDLRVQPPAAAMPAARTGWVDAVAAHPQLAGLRADARASLLMVAHALAAVADQDATACVTWADLIQATDLSRTSVARHLARLRRWELLVPLWSTSMSPSGHHRRWTPGDYQHLARHQGNQAPVYLLTCPPPPPSTRQGPPLPPPPP